MMRSSQLATEVNDVGVGQNDQQRRQTSVQLSPSRGSIVYGKSVRKRITKQDPPPSRDNGQIRQASTRFSHPTHLEPPAEASLAGSQLPTPNNDRTLINSRDDEEEWDEGRSCAPKIWRRSSSKRNVTDGLHHLRIEPMQEPIDPWERDVSPLGDAELLR
jgi:hypothetical protein